MVLLISYVIKSGILKATEPTQNSKLICLGN